MSKRRSYLKHLVLVEMQRARIDGRHGDLITLILDALRRAGCCGSSEPSLEDMRWLIADTFRMQRRPPVTVARSKHSTWLSSLLSDNDVAGAVSDTPCEV